MPESGKRFRTVVLAIYAIAGAALVYGGLRTHFSNGYFGVLLPIVSIGMVRLLILLKLIQLPPWFEMGFVNRAPKYVEFAKAAACAFGALIWTVIGVRLVGDTPVGATILFLPPVLLLIAMGVFVLRGLFS